ncbi:hypothetical protein [Hymenobacter negativus]|uniref:Uncharacterized protein n=1 Tax=Hymenobacter negativus TaxID=2795026 RepID=A0ABS0QBH7_9BACT|nr:hypothetical protein [Hymenobacter negativus]MBH8560018.1 hypothetical protein [Hymenobacter negativus]
MPAPTHLLIPYSFRRKGILLGALLGILLTACQPRHEQAAEAATPPVGHYEGSLNAAGQPEVRATLDIRHPSPGHYEAEFTAPGTLSFVADTIVFSNNQLRLIRPARPGQTLALTLEGDFWRGALTLDSTRATTILVKRGVPTPSTYRAEEVPQATGSAWLFTPADTGTPGAALALLPDAETAPTAAIWADALAREGLIVLLLPPTDSATAAAETPRLLAAVRLLRGTAGADTANVGVWATGARAAAVAQLLTTAEAPRVAFLMAHNMAVGPASNAVLRELRRRKLAVLGLYGGTTASQRATALRNALGGRRGGTVLTFRTAGPDLLRPDGGAFGPGLPGAVVEWLQGK